MNRARLMFFRFPMQLVFSAESLALFNAGSSILARIAMIAITTRSSINVNRNALRFKHEMDERVFG